MPDLVALPCCLCWRLCRHGLSGPMFFYPLRDLGRRELTALCQHLSLAVVEPSPYAAAAEGRGNGSSGSINALAAGFVETLQANNAGSVSNIVGTISKLQVQMHVCLDCDGSMVGRQQIVMVCKGG